MWILVYRCIKLFTSFISTLYSKWCLRIKILLCLKNPRSQSHVQGRQSRPWSLSSRRRGKLLERWITGVTLKGLGAFYKKLQFILLLYWTFLKRRLIYGKEKTEEVVPLSSNGFRVVSTEIEWLPCQKPLLWLLSHYIFTIYEDKLFIWY